MEYKLIPSSTEIIINKAAGPADGNHAELWADTRIFSSHFMPPLEMTVPNYGRLSPVRCHAECLIHIVVYTSPGDPNPDRHGSQGLQ